ncbi:hypothetical protein D3C72_411830 [compost metagenome]
MFGGFDCAQVKGSFIIDPTVMTEKVMTARFSEWLGETPGAGEEEVAASIGNEAEENFTDARDGKPIRACSEFDAIGGGIGASGIVGRCV